MCIGCATLPAVFSPHQSRASTREKVMVGMLAKAVERRHPTVTQSASRFPNVLDFAEGFAKSDYPVDSGCERGPLGREPKEVSAPN